MKKGGCKKTKSRTKPKRGARASKNKKKNTMSVRSGY